MPPGAREIRVLARRVIGLGPSPSGGPVQEGGARRCLRTGGLSSRADSVPRPGRRRMVPMVERDICKARAIGFHVVIDRNDRF